MVQEAAKSRPTSIVITGSKQGITNPPGNAAYNASKSAVKTLTEHLSWDLRDTKTSVHLLVPGWTFTGMVSNSYPNILPFSSPAGRRILLYMKLTFHFPFQTGGGQTKEKPAGAWAPEQVADFLYKKMEQDKFYIICPDNETTEETDKKRMLWSTGDIINERPPLTRWRPEWKEEATETIAKTKV